MDPLAERTTAIRNEVEGELAPYGRWGLIPNYRSGAGVIAQ